MSRVSKSEPSRSAPSRRHVLAAGAALVPVLIGARRAHAQAAYPDRIIKLVVPWPPGGITDVTGRLLASRMSADLGQTMYVENRAGAAGTVGHAAVAQAEPDGYTVLLATNSTYAIAPHLLPQLSYDGDKAFRPVGLVARSPQILCCRPALPIKDFAGFLDYVRARQPDGVTFMSAGPGSSSHLAAELLMSMAGFRMLHVPFRGGGPAMQALISGDIDVGFVDAVIALPFQDSDKLRMLGTSWSTPMPQLPDVPAIAQVGVTGFQSSTDLALLVAAATPDAIVRKLSATLLSALQAPEVRDKMIAQGAIIAGGAPEAFAAYLAEESRKWGEVIRSRQIKMP